MSQEQEFLTAVQKGDVTRVRELLRSDRGLAAVKNADGVSAVLLACYYRQKEVAAELVASGLELNVFEAAALGQAASVKALLKKDASLANAFAPDGFTPLGLAAFFGHKPVVDILLAGGAKPNQAANNAMKVMPLHSAASSRQTEIARLLIDSGADVNARQQASYAPLHAAAMNGDMELAKLLLDHGADVRAKNDSGDTPLGLAVKNDRVEMAQLLRRHGATE